jgi:hypothetical protein
MTNPRTKIILLGLLTACTITSQPVGAQSIPVPIWPPQPPPEPPPEPLPPLEELLQPSPDHPSTPTQLPDIPETIMVERFEIVGSTVFSTKQLAAVTADFTQRPITFSQLLQAAQSVSQLYFNQGYITSGAFVPANQTFSRKGGIVKILIVEGRLEEIIVNGTGRLNPDYIRSRLKVRAKAPLNRLQLVEALELLQLDPLLKSVTAQLSAGSQPGLSVLTVQVSLADTFSLQPILDNEQTPSVGSFRRGVQLNEANLLGQGDGLTLTYFNTDGSNSLSVNYTYPVNPHNGTLNISYQPEWNHIIEAPFDELDIRGNSFDLEFTYRQPILETPRQELALSVSMAREESNTSLLGVPFPLSVGANDQGETRLSVLRFSQDYLQRSSQEVLALRSQFSVGLGLLEATHPEGQFFSWLGQAQWVKQLAPETLFLWRTDIQLANKDLVPLEQLGIGGPTTVRGYRQNLLLANSGLILTGEFRLPVLRIPQVSGLLQVTPFLDFGTGFDHSNTPNLPNPLFSVGLGLLWQMGNTMNARFDYGIPLMSVSSNGSSWQEQGFSFSLIFNFF